MKALQAVRRIVAAVASALPPAKLTDEAARYAREELQYRAQVTRQAAARRAECARLVDELLGGDGGDGYLRRRRGWLR